MRCPCQGKEVIGPTRQHPRRRTIPSYTRSGSASVYSDSSSLESPGSVPPHTLRIRASRLDRHLKNSRSIRVRQKDHLPRLVLLVLLLPLRTPPTPPGATRRRPATPAPPVRVRRASARRERRGICPLTPGALLYAESVLEDRRTVHRLRGGWGGRVTGGGWMSSTLGCFWRQGV